jgi:hypothetical protein
MDFSGWHGAANDPRVRDLTAALAKLSPAPGQAAPAKSARPPRPKWFVPAIAAMAVAVLALGAGSLWLMVRNGDAAWLDKEALPQMEALIDSGDWEGAYALAQRAEQRLPESRAIEEFWPRLSWKTTITSEPSGAKVFRRAYNAPADAAWEELGVTPLENIRIPFGYSRLRFELAGYQTLNRAIGGGIRTSQELRPDTLMAHVFAVGAGNFKLDPLDGLYPDKVRVPGGDMLINGQLVKFADYFIDRTG